MFHHYQQQPIAAYAPHFAHQPQPHFFRSGSLPALFDDEFIAYHQQQQAQLSMQHGMFPSFGCGSTGCTPLFVPSFDQLAAGFDAAAVQFGVALPTNSTPVAASAISASLESDGETSEQDLLSDGSLSSNSPLVEAWCAEQQQRLGDADAFARLSSGGAEPAPLIEDELTSSPLSSASSSSQPIKAQPLSSGKKQGKSSSKGVEKQRKTSSSTAAASGRTKKRSTPARSSKPSPAIDATLPIDSAITCNDGGDNVQIFLTFEQFRLLVSALQQSCGL